MSWHCGKVVSWPAQPNHRVSSDYTPPSVHPSVCPWCHTHLLLLHHQVYSIVVVVSLDAAAVQTLAELQSRTHSLLLLPMSRSEQWWMNCLSSFSLFHDDEKRNRWLLLLSPLFLLWSVVHLRPVETVWFTRREKKGEEAARWYKKQRKREDRTKFFLYCASSTMQSIHTQKWNVLQYNEL